MLFKFVRVDSPKPYKIDLPLGKHTIGRGKFLLNEINDPKVSRKHAELQVTNKTVTVTSLHINPCFYIRKGKENKEILSKGLTVTLCNGDRLGVLPETYWFELIFVLTDDGQQDHAITEENNTKESVVNEPANGIIVKEELNEHLNDTVINAEGQESNLVHNMNNEAQSTQDDDNVPAATGNNIVTTPVKRQHNPQDSSTNDGTKKIKTEPENIPDPIQIFGGLLTSMIAGLGDPTSANSGPSTNQNPADNSGPSGQPSQANPPLRERCMYGDKCYRINPEHKRQFSHPQDEDWAPESRGDCPRGAACRRTRRAHRTHYRHPPDAPPSGEHPPGERPPDAHPSDAHPFASLPTGYVPGMRTVQRNGNIYYINAHTVTFNDDAVEAEDSDGNEIEEEEVDDEYYTEEEEDSAITKDNDRDEEISPASSHQILTGKRVRKTLKRSRELEWSDSEEIERDPYATDDSDDWLPPNSISHGQD